MAIIGTVLKHMTFLLLCVVHLFCPEHNTHNPSIYAYYIVSFHLPDQLSHVHVLGLKYFFETTLLD